MPDAGRGSGPPLTSAPSWEPRWRGGSNASGESPVNSTGAGGSPGGGPMTGAAGGPMTGARVVPCHWRNSAPSGPISLAGDNHDTRKHPLNRHFSSFARRRWWVRVPSSPPSLTWRGGRAHRTQRPALGREGAIRGAISFEWFLRGCPRNGRAFRQAERTADGARSSVPDRHLGVNSRAQASVRWRTFGDTRPSEPAT
jgi:hypothetical protein